MKPIRVLVVDDHRAVLEGLRRILESDLQIEAVGGASSGEQALVQAPRLRPDVVLMDIKMPGMGGIKTIKKLKKKLPATRIIVLSMYDDEQYITEAIQAGAIGYLTKDISQEELCRAIRRACDGQSSFSSSIVRTPVTPSATLTEVETAGEHDLSERQLEILRLMAAGATNKEIAAQLFLNHSAIKREIKRVFTELGVSRRAEAVAKACGTDVIRPPAYQGCGWQSV